jgi:branched-chain amino acid transport system substrate-binding protein
LAIIHALACLAQLPLLQAAPEPNANLREAELAYHGPSEDFENLTELRLGWFGPSDVNDPLTGDLWFAATLAIEEANAERSSEETPSPTAARPSAPLPFRLIPRWAVDPWGTGVSQLTRMVYEEQPLALLGSIDSASTHLAEQVVAKANLPLVSPFATDASITLAGVPWIFTCAPADDAIARALADAILGPVSVPASDSADASLPAPRAAPSTQHASRVTRHSSLVLLSTTDHESRMTSRAILREFSRRGGLPDLRVEIAAGTTDLTPQLAATIAAAPTAVLIVAGIEDAARLAQALRAELGSVALFGGPSLARRRFAELAGPTAEGIVVPALFAPTGTDAAASDFVARFTTARGHAPDFAAALAYDATRLLTTAIRRAGPNRARIRQTLIELSPWTSVTGTIAFDGTGQNRAPAVALGRIHDGAVVPNSQ